MKKRCQTVNFVLYCLLWLAVEEITINGEPTDRSENDLKTLSKRNADNIDVLKEEKDSSFKHIANELYDIYGEPEDKRALETIDDMDLDNVDHNVSPYLVLEELGDDNKSDYYDDKEESSENDDEKRGIDRYSVFGTLGKRLKAPMGFSGRLGKRKNFVEDYDKRIPLGFVGALGKRAPMGFRGVLGKRAPMGFKGQLGKRAPMGFRGQLGKRAPLGFRGQLGKRAPMGFLGSLGKRAPMGFLGSLGKRAPMGFLGSLGKRDPPYFFGPERRAPMGFRGQLGKRGGPMGFIGQLGKREA